MEALLKKLNHRPGTPVVLLNWPASGMLARLAQAIEATSSVQRGARGTMVPSYILLFAASEEELASHAAQLDGLLQGDCTLWTIYPKKRSPNYNSYIHRDAPAWTRIGQFGYEGVRMVSIDQDHSALRFRHVDYIRKMTRAPERAMSTQGKIRVSNTNPRSDQGEN